MAFRPEPNLRLKPREQKKRRRPAFPFATRSERPKHQTSGAQNGSSTDRADIGRRKPKKSHADLSARTRQTRGEVGGLFRGQVYAAARPATKRRAPPVACEARLRRRALNSARQRCLEGNEGSHRQHQSRGEWLSVSGDRRKIPSTGAERSTDVR